MFLKYFQKTSFIITIFIIVTSCNKDNLQALKSIELRLVSVYTEQPIDNAFVFKVMGDNLDDLTSHAQIKVNGQLIAGNSFIPTLEGTYLVQAFYENYKSKKLTVKAITPSNYTKKVLVEDYTGTWCGFCPRVTYAIQQAKLQSNKIVSVAIHLTSAIPDPFHTEQGLALKSEFGISGLPRAKINRIHTWTANEPEHLNEVLNRTGFNAPLGLAIATELINNTIQTQVRVGFANNYSEQLNLVIYVLENGLIYNQTNYTSYYGGATTLIDYVHNDVLRKVETPILGEPIPTSETVQGHIYSKNYNITIPSTVFNNSNLVIVAFVVKASNKEVINVQEVHVGNTVSFE